MRVQKAIGMHCPDKTLSNRIQQHQIFMIAQYHNSGSTNEPIWRVTGDTGVTWKATSSYSWSEFATEVAGVEFLKGRVNVVFGLLAYDLVTYSDTTFDQSTSTGELHLEVWVEEVVAVSYSESYPWLSGLGSKTRWLITDIETMLLSHDEDLLNGHQNTIEWLTRLEFQLVHPILLSWRIPYLH